MTTTYPNLEIESFDPQIRLIRVARPKVLNALDQATLASLDQALEEAANDASIRALILTGQGEKAFIAGSDIAALSQMNPAQAEAFSRLGQKASNRLSQAAFPTIAMVNGFALGSGAEFAMACDIIVASDNAVFGLPEVSLGVIPGHGGAVRLPHWVGWAKARELIFSGRKVKADEAARIGLANHVFPQAQLLDETLKIARAIANQSSTAVAAAKHVLNSQLGSLEEPFHAETQQFAALFGSVDQQEGMLAFAQKRLPQFQ